MTDSVPANAGSLLDNTQYGVYHTQYGYDTRDSEEQGYTDNQCG